MSYVDVGSAPSTDVSFSTAAEMASDQGHGHEQIDSRCSSRASSSLLDSWTEHVEDPVRHSSPPPAYEQAHKWNVAQRGMDMIQSWLSSRNCGETKYSCVFCVVTHDLMLTNLLA